jgi:hypothetical protein
LTAQTPSSKEPAPGDVLQQPPRAEGVVVAEGDQCVGGGETSALDGPGRQSAGCTSSPPPASLVARPARRCRHIGSAILAAGSLRLFQGGVHQGSVCAVEPRRTVPAPSAVPARPLPRCAVVAGRTDQRAGTAQNTNQLIGDRQDLARPSDFPNAEFLRPNLLGVSMHDLDPSRTPMWSFGDTNLGERWIPVPLPPPRTPL